jgi:flagellar motor switch protein FliM
MAELSQKDIDSLLKGTPAFAMPVRTGGVEVVPYNFLRPPRISRDRRATIETIYSRFAVSVQQLLSSRLRVPTDVVVNSVEQATFGEFVLSLGNPCAAYIFDLGSSISGVMDLGTDLSFFLVDRMFGGPGDSDKPMNRALTPLERLAVKGLTDRALQFLGEVWQDYVAFLPVHVAFESVPEALQLASKEDNVLVANIDVKTAAFSGLMTICIPLLALETFLQEKPAAVKQAHRPNSVEAVANRAQLERTLRFAKLPIAARFPVFRLRARDVATLKVGQVISTGFSTDTPLEVHVNGRVRFRGVPGQVKRSMGVRVTQSCTNDQPCTSPMVRDARIV